MVSHERLNHPAITLRQARSFVREHHLRHHKPQGRLWAMAVPRGDDLVGGAIAGRPRLRRAPEVRRPRRDSPAAEIIIYSAASTLTAVLRPVRGQHLVRGMAATHPELYKAADYTASQTFGEAIRASGGDGIVYDSVRHVGGINVVALRPKNVRDVVMGTHYEITAPVSGKVIARALP
jgi:hypothetical protein